MDIKEIIRIYNEYNALNRLPLLDIGDKINIPHETSTNLDENSYIIHNQDTE